MSIQTSTFYNQVSYFRSLYHQLDLTCKKNPKLMLITGLGLGAIGLISSQSGYTALGAIPLLSFSTSLGLISKTAWTWKHIASHLLHDTYNFSYTPSLNHSTLAPRAIEMNQTTIIKRKITNNQKLPFFDLSLHSIEPKIRGYIQGLVLGQEIYDMKHQVLPLMVSEASRERNDTHKTYLKSNIKNLHIPQNCYEEMIGIREGYQNWAANNHVSETNDEVMEFLLMGHTLTDTYKAIGSGHGLTQMGCSTIVLKDPSSKDIIVGRLLDWVSLGTIGQNLYLKSYYVPHQEENMCVFSHTFPGFIGGLTCWNQKGLVAIVNELGTTTLGKGTPYSIFVKELIEQSTSFKEAHQKIILWQGEEKNRAASSFTLTLADTHEAAMYFFYSSGIPDSQGYISLQSCAWSPETTSNLTSKEFPFTKIAYGVYQRSLMDVDEPLVVTNHAYIRMNEYIQNSICDDTTKQRLERIFATYSQTVNESGEKRVEKMLQAAGEMATIGAYIFNVTQGKLRIGNDNYNAAKLIPQMKETDMYFKNS